MESIVIVGADEVGRGALAGPLVVAAATVPETTGFAEALLHGARLPALRDSKKLTLLMRERAYVWLEKRLPHGIGVAEASEIDQLGLRPAADLALDRALANLGIPPTRIVLDAGLYHSREQEVTTLRFIKGDETIVEITLASIMAKVWRDRLMHVLAPTYPGYGWENNVGYGSVKHIQAIKNLGLSPQHRRSFLRTILKLPISAIQKSVP
jgi:ribonuclease HII